MKIKEAQKKYSNIEIDILLAHVLKKSKDFLYLNPDFKLTTKQFNNLTSFIKRRQTGEPIAYILGYKNFYGLDFIVNKNVLIPRPETERLVDAIVASGKLLVARRKPVRILDIATGSGCIAVSVAKKLESRNQKVEVFASDISPAALKVAKQNAKNNKVKIKFIQSDLFKKINGKFDVIAANLPYVPLKMLHKFLLHKTDLKIDDPFLGLKYEPSFALTDGTSRWQIYNKFFEQVKNHIHDSSVILLETDPASKKFLTEYQQKNLPDWQMKFYKDFNNLLRFVEIKK